MPGANDDHIEFVDQPGHESPARSCKSRTLRELYRNGRNRKRATEGRSGNQRRKARVTRNWVSKRPVVKLLLILDAKSIVAIVASPGAAQTLLPSRSSSTARISMYPVTSVWPFGK